jgi:hypothetical protein
MKNVKNQVLDQVRTQFWYQVLGQVGGQVWRQVRTEFWYQVEDQVWDQVREEFNEQH